ncbi:MAG: DUF2809 domain-containing protein [Microbacterium sp.]|nr:MAG: DUF2809 domain-containing protein [Microbacterium sp.]
MSDTPSHRSTGVAARRRRIAASGALAAVIAAGLLVHTQLPDTALTDIAGDALYAAAAYAGIVLLLPRLGPPVVAGIAAAWCVGVELFQLTGLPGLWAQAFPPVVLLLGTVYDARDLIVYLATVVVVALVDALVRGRRAAS